MRDGSAKLMEEHDQQIEDGKFNFHLWTAGRCSDDQ